MNRIKVSLAAVIAALTMVPAFAAGDKTGDNDRQHVLKIYNWADYIDEDLLYNEFPKWYKEQTGEDIKIVYSLFDINEIMLTKIEKGHEDYDVACPSDYIIERMLRNDLLLPGSESLVGSQQVKKLLLCIRDQSGGAFGGMKHLAVACELTGEFISPERLIGKHPGK